jgi:hypothetical protein
MPSWPGEEERAFGVDLAGLPFVSAEQVALIPECAECDARSLPADEERWAAYLTDDEPPEVVLYCPACAEREFGCD